MFDRRVKLGMYWGIDVYVHWTFALLVAYVAYSVRDGGPAVVAFNLLLLIHVFLCVTLHEYGHALTARRFGISTVDITLLPIGGVARLRRMPRVPWQELLVAVAGPAVNVVIAISVMGILFIAQPDALRSVYPIEYSQAFLDRLDIALSDISLPTFLMLVLAVNIALVLFNMIPAFPMDGGRVLRSVLAMVLEYRKATYVAFAVGVVCAMLLAKVAIQNGLVTAGLIAAFVVYAGLNESRQVAMMEKVRGVNVSDVMIYNPPSISIDVPLTDLPAIWQSQTVDALPVVGVDKYVIGMLMKDEMTRKPPTQAGQLTVGQWLAELSERPDRLPIVKLRPNEAIEEIILGTSRSERYFPVVDDHGGLIGLLDLRNISARQTLQKLQNESEV